MAGWELGGGRLEQWLLPTSCSLSGDAILLQGCCLRVPGDGYIISPDIGPGVDVPPGSGTVPDLHNVLHTGVRGMRPQLFPEMLVRLLS